MSSFLRDHFDKLLVSWFVTILIGICVFFAVVHIDGKAFDWATNITEIFVGCLTGLITGIAVGKSIERNSQQPVAGKVDPQA